MKSDPKECLYCQNNETLHNLMIEIAQLSVSRVFLFKEQTYRGRCLVSYKDHVNDLNELSDVCSFIKRKRPGVLLNRPDLINSCMYRNLYC